MFDKSKLDALTAKYLEIIDIQNIKDFSASKISKVYDDLIDVLNYHNQNYYIDANPLISDYQYDKLFDYLKKVEKSYPEIVSSQSPTQKLSMQIQEEFAKAKHHSPMLSLENSYNADDLTNWAEFLQRQLEKSEISNWSYIVEPKYDGSGVELIYQNGKFVKGLTRGDGLVGEDITQNLKTIMSIPQILEGAQNIKSLSVRGEIVMSKKSLERINKERTKNGEQLFANTRNATAGSLRQLDPKVTAKRGLICYIYELLDVSDDVKIPDTHQKILQWLKNLGLNVYDFHKKYKNIDDVIALCTDEKTKQKFEGGEIEFDGLVVKVDELNLREMLGSTNHHPRWAMSYKFPATMVSTKILSVELSIGRTGAITPVANLQPVEMGGVKVSRASMHNFDYIQEKDIHIGDSVWVIRSGEVIPYILGPILDSRPKCTLQDYQYVFKDGKIFYDFGDKGINDDLSKIIKDCSIKILPPTICPKCGSLTVKIPDEVNYYCGNINCPAVLKEQIKYFVSKDCMDIQGFGDKFIDMLVDAGLINDFADIYRLSNPENTVRLGSLPLMGKKRVKELLIEIHKSKKNNLRRLINALGIKFVGKKASQLIQKAIYDDLMIISQGVNGNLEQLISDFDFKSLDNYLQNEVFLENIHGIGEKTIKSLNAFMSNDVNIQILQNMQNTGVLFNDFSNLQNDALDSEIDGLKFSITGKFDISREKIVQILEDAGMTWDEQPTKETNIIIVGEGGGNKLKKAQTYDILQIIGIDGLIQKFPVLESKFQDKKENNFKQDTLF